MYPDLEHLNDPITMDNVGKSAMIFLRMVPPCFVSGFSSLGKNVLNTIGFVACNRAGDPLLTSTLSMTIFFNALTMTSLNYESTEKAGIALSQAYGAKDYARYKKYFTQALLLGVSYWSLLGIPFMLFMKNILITIHIIPQLAESIQNFYWKLAMTEILRLTSSMFMVAANSQGIETKFFWLIISNTVISASFMCFLCFYLNMTLDALIYASIMFHSINMLIFMRIYLRECHPKTIGLVPLTTALPGLLSYTKDWLKFYVGIWFEWLSWESTSYFVALTDDIHQVSAFGSLVNLAYVFHNFQVGLEYGARSRMNYLLATGSVDAAKRCFYVMFVGIVCLNIPIGAILFVCREYIADIYAGNIKQTRAYFLQIMVVYCIAMSSDIIHGLLSLAARTIDHVDFSIAMNITFMLGVMGVTHYIIVNVLHLTVIWLTVNMYVTFTLVYGLLFLKFSLYDWHKAPILSD